MNQLPFIWLGAGRARKRGVAVEGRLLDTAACAGLPVPAGALLLDEFYRLLVDAGVVVVENGRLIISNPHWLHETFYTQLRFPQLNRRVTVRAVTDIEAFVNDVDLKDAGQLAQALNHAWSALGSGGTASRRDVLILEMVTTSQSGVAWSRQRDQGDLVREGTAHESFELPQLHGWQRPDSHLPPFARRLQQLLRGVRRTVGEGEWEISWADDGRVCWLTWLRPGSPAAPTAE
jgi:rifampicin phosphotransferase